MSKYKDYKVGIYVRLSKEDSRCGESVSIENQKVLLTNHVDKMGWNLIKIYQDDGFSGTNQNRPAFQQMIADVKEGFINTILIKDLSRLGRNYLDVGNLAEVFLPEHNCELISLNEKLDDMMVFRNWFNEQHSKTTSIKVRAGKRVSAQNGKFLGTYAPYGYKKDPYNNHRLIIDKNTSPVVEQIFQMRESGMGLRSIAIKLNNDGIISPREYYYQNINMKNPQNNRGIWSENTIRDIIKNEVYIGNLVSGKYGTVSYKNQKQIKKDKNEWIRVENTHQPIIDNYLWNKLQSSSYKKYVPKRKKDGSINLFTGLLYCSDCGFRLRGQVYKRSRKNGSKNEYISYMCSTYSNHGKNFCTCHGISEKALTDLILHHIKSLACPLKYNYQSIAQSILSLKKTNKKSWHGAYNNELKTHKAKIKKLDILMENLYEDRVSGIVPQTLFIRQIKKYEQERDQLTIRVKALQAKIKNTCLNLNSSETLIKLIEQHIKITSLNPEILLLLIDKIIVNEAKLIDGQRICDIKIIYNFDTNYKKSVQDSSYTTYYNT